LLYFSPSTPRQEADDRPILHYSHPLSFLHFIIGGLHLIQERVAYIGTGDAGLPEVGLLKWKNREDVMTGCANNGYPAAPPRPHLRSNIIKNMMGHAGRHFGQTQI